MKRENIILTVIVIIIALFIYKVGKSYNDFQVKFSKAEIINAEYILLEHDSTHNCKTVSIKGIMKDGIISNKEYDKFKKDCKLAQSQEIKGRLKW